MTRCVVLGSAIVLLMAAMAIGLCGEPLPASETGDPAPPLPAATNPDAARANERPTLAEARRQAEILHRAVHATLQVVHHRYYREDEGLPIPAAILGDVFAEMETEENVRLRWLAVEGKAMNADHKPNGAFEQAAAQALKAGKGAYETTENGLYRRAGAITLTSHCLKCHVPDRKNTNDRTAGLVISIPVRPE